MTVDMEQQTLQAIADTLAQMSELERAEYLLTLCNEGIN
jgi:hypothetical protein